MVIGPCPFAALPLLQRGRGLKMRTYEKPVRFRDQLPSPLLGWQLSGTRDVERSGKAQPGNTSREHHPRTLIQVLRTPLERKLNPHWSAMACRSPPPGPD